MNAIESVAAFLFASLSVARPEGMALAQFLQLGMNLRQQAGIDTLERGLKHAPQNKSQEQLRDYAQQALRRAQQRLLSQVLHAMPSSAAQPEHVNGAVDAVISKLALNGLAASNLSPQADLEQAMLDVWALSEAASAAPGLA